MNPDTLRALAQELRTNQRFADRCNGIYERPTSNTAMLVWADACDAHAAAWEADIEAYDRCEKSYDHLSIENVTLRQRLVAALRDWQNDIDRWNVCLNELAEARQRLEAAEKALRDILDGMEASGGWEGDDELFANGMAALAAGEGKP